MSENYGGLVAGNSFATTESRQAREETMARLRAGETVEQLQLERRERALGTSPEQERRARVVEYSGHTIVRPTQKSA